LAVVRRQPGGERGHDRVRAGSQPAELPQLLGTVHRADDGDRGAPGATGEDPVALEGLAERPVADGRGELHRRRQGRDGERRERVRSTDEIPLLAGAGLEVEHAQLVAPGAGDEEQRPGDHRGVGPAHLRGRRGAALGAGEGRGGEEGEESRLHGEGATHVRSSVLRRQYCFSPTWARSRGASRPPLTAGERGTSTTATRPSPKLLT